MGQGISVTQFFVYGKKHFTRTGYLKAKKKYTSPAQEKAAIGVGKEGADGVNLEGKVVVISGANSGIGKELATYAAAKGAKLYMLCRNKERAEAAKKDIIQAISEASSSDNGNNNNDGNNNGETDKNDNINILLADIGELDQVRTAVKTLTTAEQNVHCLICNAGLLLNERKETSEGREVTYASHLLGGSYLLATLLLPQLKAAGEEARTIFVSSGGMYTTKFPSWEVATCAKSGDGYNGQFSYAYAKRGQLLLAERYSRDHPEVAWVSTHPGWTETPAVSIAYGSAKGMFQPFRTPWQGSEGIAWLMSTPRQNLESGAFYLDRTPQKKHLAGPFMSEGSFTKNTEEEVDTMMNELKKDAGI